MKLKSFILSIIFVLFFVVAQASTIVRLSTEYFPDPTRGKPVSSGSIYIGVPDLDPEIIANQIQVTAVQESGVSVAISQPISTSAGGVPLYNGSPVILTVSESYSLKVLDSYGSQVYYIPNSFAQSVSEILFLSDYSCDLAAAISDIGANITTIIIDCDAIVASGTTVTTPKTLSLDIIKGGSIDGVAGGDTETLTINGPLSAGVYQIFGSNLTVNGKPQIEKAYPQWWGAISDLGTGDTDNTSAFTKAVTFLKAVNGSTGGILDLGSAGTGFLTGEIAVTSYRGLVVKGNNTKMQMIDTGTNDYVFKFTTCQDIIVEKVHFVGTSDTVATYDSGNKQSGIGVIGGSNVTVRDCFFEKFISMGIYSEDMTPSTVVEGMRIYNNIFRDFPLDATTSEQCAIYLDSEYSIVQNNTFQFVPSAARFFNGANSKFIDNIVFNLNGQYNTTSAAFYHEDSDNFGKLEISRNTFNHIDSGQVLMKIQGDTAIDRNPVYIRDNQMLSNGTITHARHIWIVEMDRTQITNNSIRPNVGISLPAGEECIRVEDSKDVLISGNYLNRGDYAVTNDNSTLIFGQNTIENQDTGVLQTLNGGTFKVIKNRTYGFHVLANGTAGSDIFDDPGVTIPAHATPGYYEFVHSFGSENYTVSITSDELTTAVERHWEIVRRAAVLDIRCYDGTGTPVLVDQDFVMTITHGIDSEYLLDLE